MKKKIATSAILAAALLVAGMSQFGFTPQTGTVTDAFEPSALDKVMRMGGLELTMPPAFAQIPLDEVEKLMSEGRHVVEFNLIGKSVELPIMGGGTYKAMTFNEQVPGPTLRVTQGDVIVMTLTVPEDEATPHGNDMHASQMSAVPNFGAVMPGTSKSYAYIAEVPGTFKYHCSGVNIADMDRHVLSGMYGMTIVDPLKGYKKLIVEKTAVKDGKVVRVNEDYSADALEFQLQFNQLYLTDDGSYNVEAMFMHQNNQTVVNGMAFGYTPNADHAELIKGNRNQRIFVAEPWRDAPEHLQSQVIWVPTKTHTRWFVENQGNEPVFFHIVGEIMDRVYQGNKQQSWGTETWLIGGSQGAIIDVVFDEPGVYVAVNHDYAAIFSGAATVIVAGDPFGLGIDPSEMPNPSDAVPPVGKQSIEQKHVVHGLMTDERAADIADELGKIEKLSHENPSFLFESIDRPKKFSSHDELKGFLQNVLERQKFDDQRAYNGAMALPVPEPLAVMASDSAPERFSSELADFSTTNVQVQGVDEPDFLKNDGRYVYILSNDKLTIIDTYPPENATIVTKVGLDVQRQNLQDMFLNKDRLIIFYESYESDYIIEQYGYQPIPIRSSSTHAIVLDISDTENPEVLKNYAVRGKYHDARMIGDDIYFVTRSDINYHHPIVPSITESSRTIMIPDVYYFDNPDLYYEFNTVTAIDIFGDEINADTFMMNSAGTMYVSEDSIYITYPKYLPYTYYEEQVKEKFFKIIVPLLPKEPQNKIRSIENSNLGTDEQWNKVSEVLQDTYKEMSEDEKRVLFRNIQEALEEYEILIAQELEKTVIHKIGIDRLALNHASSAEVPGHLLNQFSMDEFGDNFRIATTSEAYTSKGRTMHNSVYVLDEELKIVGKLEGIAPDERIYSARFMGDKLYLVTFRQVDPFFVIDLTDKTPKVLGYLKIPGFSNYLHPYDENHIIGIGRETKENKWGGVSTLGIKISLFDVSDVSNPVQVDVFTIGDRGTNSEGLYDHKAFLFDKKKDVLSIPIEFNGYKVSEEGIHTESNPWIGFYVLGVDVEDGFRLKGKIDHSTGYDPYSYEKYGDYGSRSFYIEDVLYTVTSKLMKMNDLEDMSEINQLKLGTSGEVIKYID